MTADQVRRRVADGLVNVVSASQGKSYARILRDNLLTLFNLLNFALAACVILVGSYTNALFIGVIICNIIIGTYQEIRAKRTIEKLKVVSAPTARAVRDGVETELAVEQLVLDDITIWRAGMQLSADCVVVEGTVEVNESLLTGESDALFKQPGDTLMSGSFIVSGECRARVEHVGDDNYAARIAGDAKQFKKPNSELMRSLNLIIKSISFAIVPIGGALFLKQYYIMHMTLRDAVVNTVAAMIGMIPEGLILLTSVALAVGVIRLAQRRTLVQQLYCIETLARVDTLCLDKTGTITTGEMQVTDLIPIDASYEYASAALNAFTHAMTDDNPTNRALKARFNGATDWKCTYTEPFSSARKWSAAQFTREGSIVLGAPEFVLGPDYARIRAQVEDYAARGLRVLVLAHSNNPLGNQALPEGKLELCALIVIGDTLRPEAPATLEYFARQEVDIKVISGDNPVTVASVAQRAGLKDADRLIDLSTLPDDQVAAAADKYTVFGRVTPQRKRILVNALKQRGHTVAMTGGRRERCARAQGRRLLDCNGQRQRRRASGGKHSAVGFELRFNAGGCRRGTARDKQHIALGLAVFDQDDILIAAGDTDAGVDARLSVPADTADAVLVAGDRIPVVRAGAGTQHRARARQFPDNRAGARVACGADDCAGCIGVHCDVVRMGTRSQRSQHDGGAIHGLRGVDVAGAGLPAVQPDTRRIAGGVHRRICGLHTGVAGTVPAGAA